MANLLSMIIEADVLGVEASLYAQKGSTQNKNLFGGIISILMIILIFIGSVFFVSQFFDRSQLSLISNFEENPNVMVKSFDKLPFMVRLSGNLNALIPDNYYKITYFAVAFDETKGGGQTSFPVKMEKCDLDTHFGTRKDLFKNVQDIQTYFCPVWDRNFDLSGIYGSTNFTYGIMFFAPCVGSDECAERKLVYSSLSSSYLDYVTVTNMIQHYEPDPNKESLFKGRIAVSSTIYKRIWVYFEMINYATDFGYIFEEKKLINFNDVKDYSVDVDLRNVTDTNFLWLTLLNYPTTLSFTRSYMKAQALLANIGGIIKGLSICGMIITYPIANNLSNQAAINSIYDKSSSFRIEISDSNYDKSRISQSTYGLNSEPRKSSFNKKFVGNKVDKYKEKDMERINTKSSIDAYKSVTDNNLLNNEHNHIIPNQQIELKRKAKLKKTIVNNFTNEMNEHHNTEVGKLKKFYNFTKLTFKLSILNLLDPFQCCLDAEKKTVYNERLNKAYRLLNRDNLLASIQELNSLKNIIFEETQLDYFENLFKIDSNNSLLSRCFNSINKENDEKNYNSRLVSLLISS